MLTADKEFNRDYNKNNLFLNLDFQNQEETFEYKHPLLDIPSNYQVMVTKLTTRTSLPYIKLHDSKKNLTNVTRHPFLFDYLIKMEIEYLTKLYSSSKKEEYKQFLFLDDNENYQAEGKLIFHPIRTRDYTKWKDFIDPTIEYNQDYVRIVSFYDSGKRREIFSLTQIYQMINNALSELFNKMLKHTEVHFSALKKMDYLLQFKYDSGIPVLNINKTFLEMMNRNNILKYNLFIKLYFSKNLFRFLKGFPLIIDNDYEEEEEFFCLNIPNLDIFSEIETKENIIIATKFYENGNYLDEDEIPKTTYPNAYYSLDGVRMNIMEISDYIGLAITCEDFPIMEQIYPHFDFNFKKDLALQNRRRYIPKSEGNITSFYVSNRIFRRKYFVKEPIVNPKRFTIGERILFIKYFGKDEDLNCINYENNDTNSSLKMDLINSMPLKKFTLKLYLIDRYNNFEPLCPKIEGFDDVIKFQLLFTRIIGDNKENRDIIETEISKPEKVYLKLVDDEEEETNDEEEKEITPPPEPEPEPEPEVLLLPIPIPVKSEELEENEENLEAPPEKRIYLNTEEGENPENELY